MNPRVLRTATKLPDGKVLSAGGGVGTVSPTTAELLSTRALSSTK
jgi:hypothetical protein